MALKSKWGRIQPEIQPSSDRKQDISRKPLEVSRNALRAKITYEPLVAHNAFIYDTTDTFNQLNKILKVCDIFSPVYVDHICPAVTGNHAGSGVHYLVPA